MAKFAPIEFFKQVRTEVRKVTWPSRAETTQSAIAVLIMVAIASIFLFTADQIMAWAISRILGLNS